MQRGGEAMVPELRSGQFDEGLKAALDGDRSGEASFRRLLENYQGPRAVQLENAYLFSFSRFVAVRIPFLVEHAWAYGKVDLELTVEPATGEVLDTMVLRGDPLLTPAAVEMARQWRFESRSVASRVVMVTLEFPPPLH